MAINETTTYDHKVEIRIPTQCGDCKTTLPESLRNSLLTDAKRDFSKWFGGYEVVRKHGGYTYPDGTLAEEEVDVVEANCYAEALEEHLEDLAIFAVRVANELSQDSVALSIDGKMFFYDRTAGIGKCLHAKKGAALALPLSVPEGRAPKSDLEKMQALYAALDNRKFNINSAKLIFNNLLSYDPTDEALPWRDWPNDLRDRLKDAPQVIAYERGFKIVYLNQSANQLSRGTTRAVISRILRDNANSFYGLFIVSNDAGDEWALVNARIADGKASRLILRSIPVGTGKGARTATDRLILVDLDGREKLTAQQIQELHDGAFDVEGVSNEFYKKIAAWYFWAQQHKGVEYPRSVTSEADKSIFFIRLLTRLIFCWFMRQKGLIPRELFDLNFIKEQLKDADHKSGTYHKAILQNLFFATLNREINERSFRRKNEAGRDGNYGVTTLYRYASLMNNPDEMLDIFKKVPFVNGGLFECLDDTSKKPEVRLDDFSENTKNNICIPNELYFGKEREIDLCKAFGDKKHKKDSVAGLIHILNQYQFTVQENTPLDQSVALDPELLGKVFENLLASYNEETKTTARKALGAFYTPREIVEYMVDEALLAYLKGKLADSSDAMDEKLRELIGYNDEPPHGFSGQEVDILIDAIDNLKALDPAVGSGAFPMGMLHKLVHILGKLDSGNEKWKQKQLAKIDDVELREQAERAFRDNPADYGRKLYLIQNCIYGVDIQPVAVQIAKMRFFISLIVDQKSTDDPENNYGILALPNLETNFVAANTLIGIDRPAHLDQLSFRNDDIKQKESELHRIRQDHFNAKTPKAKAKCREKDEKLRTEIAELLKHEGWGDEIAKKLANWNPYDQNAWSKFFDPEWMFWIRDGFDILIGNPPYIKEYTYREAFDGVRNSPYYQGKMDLWYLFACMGLDYLKNNSGVLSFIATNNWVTNTGASKLRNKIVNDGMILKLIDFCDYKIFESADIQTMILICLKSNKLLQYNFDLRKLNRKAMFDNVISILNKEKISAAIYLNPVFDRAILKDKSLVFSDNDFEGILDKIHKKGNFLLNKSSEVAQGIVAPQDFVNKASLRILGNDFEIGDGIFIISEKERKNLSLNRSEMEFIKPYYTTDELYKYFGKSKNKYWVIYTDSSFKDPKHVKPYPNLKKHLDNFKKVITSDNAPYGLHRSRDEKFFKGEKIIALRKCNEPTFTYTDFDCYVSQTFNIIKTDRINLKYLTALLNSKLIAFYLKHRGKMQGQLYQVDKEPLLTIPIYSASAEQQKPLINLVVKIIAKKEQDVDTDISSMEREINQSIYKIYGLSDNEINLIENEE